MKRAHPTIFTQPRPPMTLTPAMPVRIRIVGKTHAYHDTGEAFVISAGAVSGSGRPPAGNGVLYLVISGAPAPEGIPDLVARCQAAGWRVLVFSTPLGVRFADTAALEKLTGEPVRSEYRMPGAGKGFPAADAVLACPLTFNSVNKFAHGHADNFAVGLLCELAGYGVPIVVVPHCKPQLASHPAFGDSIALLRRMGVTVLFDPGAPYERRLPPWREVVAALPAAVPR
jgi:phosphopantothenoylcysteine synthetase/decarboxylase